MSLHYGILGFLSYVPMTGYDISQFFSNSIDFFWHAQVSQIYRELDKMESEGLVTYEDVVQYGKPNKKVFSITDEGRESLRAWLKKDSKNRIPDVKSPFLMQIFFSEDSNLENLKQQVQAFLDESLDYKKRLRKGTDLIDAYRTVTKDKFSPFYWALTSDFGERYNEICIAWAQDTLLKIEAALEGNINPPSKTSVKSLVNAGKFIAKTDLISVKRKPPKKKRDNHET